MAKLEIGVLVYLSNDPARDMKKVADLGLRSCQVCSWEPPLWTPTIGKALLKAAADCRVEITTFWAGYPGKKAWDFVTGPTTIGLVPPATRAMRLAALMKAAKYAAGLGLPSITTHAGFIPENASDPLFPGTVRALTTLAKRCKGLGIELWFETGQETPVTLLRTFERIGTGNLGVNLDPANLILYGKANPVDALDVFGKFVRGVHAKDGLYPTDGDHLGREVPIGKGKVDFPVLIRRLKALGYRGALTIEREISGPKQIADIRQAVKYLRPMC